MPMPNCLWNVANIFSKRHKSKKGLEGTWSVQAKREGDDLYLFLSSIIMYSYKYDKFICELLIENVK